MNPALTVFPVFPRTRGTCGVYSASSLHTLGRWQPQSRQRVRVFDAGFRRRRSTRCDDNAAVAQLDAEIDGLYQLPLEEFTAARTALAKSLKGDAARDVRALKKP